MLCATKDGIALGVVHGALVGLPDWSAFGLSEGKSEGPKD